jgi:hypothetical protein
MFDGAAASLPLLGVLPRSEKKISYSARDRYIFYFEVAAIRAPCCLVYSHTDMDIDGPYYT